MMLPPEAWMDLRHFKPLHEAGATWKEIADELGSDPRTVKKYWTRRGGSAAQRA